MFSALFSDSEYILSDSSSGLWKVSLKIYKPVSNQFTILDTFRDGERVGLSSLKLPDQQCMALLIELLR